MKRTLLAIAAVGILSAVVAWPQSYMASFVADLGSEISPDSLPCSAPDEGVIAAVMQSRLFWSRNVEPRLPGAAFSALEAGCRVTAGERKLIDGRYRCEFCVTLKIGGEREFDALLSAFDDRYRATDGRSHIVSIKKPQKPSFHTFSL